MARNRRPSDDVRNARRRFERAAARYEQKAIQATGIEKSRLESLARTSLEKAYRLYEDPAKAVGTRTMQEMQSRLNARTYRQAASDAYKKKLQTESFNVLEKKYENDDERREAEAEILMKSVVGNSLYAAMSGIWASKGYEDREQAILDYFGTDSMADVLDMIADQGIDIYAADATERYKYDEIRTSIELAFAA